MRDHPALLILRHGETEWNRAQRMQGSLDSPLTTTGRAQAEAQHRLVRDFGVEEWSWFSSPQGRARDTARIVSQGLAADVTVDARLSEIRLGQWEGKLRSDICALAPHLFEDPDSMLWYNHAPGGEGIAGLAARVDAFLSDLSTPSVIITHGITSRVMRCRLLGYDPLDFDRMPGGQGVVYHLSSGKQEMLSFGA